MEGAIRQTVGEIEIAPVILTAFQFHILTHCAQIIGEPLAYDPDEANEVNEDVTALISAGALTVEDQTKEFPVIRAVNNRVDLLAHLAVLRTASTFGSHALRFRDNDDDNTELVSSEDYERHFWHGVAEDLDRRDAAYLAFLHNSGPTIIETLLAENARLRAALAQTPDLAAYRAATRIIFQPHCFYPAFNKDAPEDQTAQQFLARATSAGVKVHAVLCEPDEGATVLDIAKDGPAKCPEYGNADLIGCWPLENGDYVLVFAEPLTPAGAA